MSFQSTIFLVLLAAWCGDAFVADHHLSATRVFSFRLQAESTAASSIVELSLPKPLGLILEEKEEGKAAGVFVKEVVDTGSAAEHASKILGATVASVQGIDVTAFNFDDAMDTLINAPDTVDIAFVANVESAVEGEADATDNSPSYDVGDVVTVVVKQEGKDDLSIEAKVGDNLRKVLLDNNFEVYQGLKQKLGNCGGGGQCTFCAMDVLESEGWEERSEYEDNKLKKNPQARLACLNNIQGPLTIKKANR